MIRIITPINVHLLLNTEIANNSTAVLPLLKKYHHSRFTQPIEAYDPMLSCVGYARHLYFIDVFQLLANKTRLHRL